MMKADHSFPRGILNAATGKDKFSLSRFQPSRPLQPFIEHYWVVRYDLHGEEPYTQTVLSYPNVHLAFEHDHMGRRSLIYGILKRPFVRKLEGAGKVLGVKFRAGGFYPYWQRDVSALTGTVIEASEVFGPGVRDLMDTVLDASDVAAMARQADHAFLTKLPERDAQAELADRIVQTTMNDRSILKVEQLCEQTGLSIRQLQRLFHKYIGVSPKWVIKRFRLQEAAERLEQGEIQLADLAMQLGYFDQSHFIKDFKSVIGQSPEAYRQSCTLS
jgi:AraC-like DNA-binding protein